MKTDPNRVCQNDVQRPAWAWIHDAISHPLMAITLWSKISLRFHNWTSNLAWPRSKPFEPSYCKVYSNTWGTLTFRQHSSGFYETSHPNLPSHGYRCKAESPLDAGSQAVKWFDSLEDHHKCAPFLKTPDQHMW